MANEPNPIHPRQIAQRDILDQIQNTYLTDLEDLLKSINSELTMPLRLKWQSSTEILIEGSIVTNPQTAVRRSAPASDSGFLGFSSGFLTLNTTTERIEANPGIDVDISSPEVFVPIIVSINLTGDIILTRCPGTSVWPLPVTLGDWPLPVNQWITGMIVLQSPHTSFTPSNIYQWVPFFKSGNQKVETGNVITSNYTVQTSDSVIRVDTNAGPVEVELGSPEVAGKIYTICDVGGVASETGHELTVKSTGFTIREDESYEFFNDYESITVVANGSNRWEII